MKKIPFLLIYSRILIGIIIGLFAVYKVNHHALWIVILMVTGLLTDVFDGIIARKLGVATEKLRIWDSNVDQFFWLVVIAAIFYLNLNYVKEQALWIILLLVLELVAYLVSYIKFKKSVATHSILAKFWTLSLTFFLIELCLTGSGSISFIICIALGIISRIEIIAIILCLKKWTTDVPSLWAVSKINKGIPVRKNKLFN